MEAPDAKRPRLMGEAQTPVSEILTLQFVEVDVESRTVKTLGSAIVPDFVHQIFAEDESIAGYENLRIKIWISLASFHAFMETSCDAKVEGADNLEQKFKDYFDYEFTSSMEDFSHQVCQTKALNPSCLGTVLLPSTPFNNGEIFVTWSQVVKMYDEIKALHYRLEPFLSFFINGFQCIDTADPDWTILLAFYKEKDFIRLIGYTTMYRFYAYPENSRYRIGQCFVLPHYQQKGIGRKMFEAAQLFVEDRNGEDLSVEDPTDIMSNLMRTFHLRRMLNADWLKTILFAKLGTEAYRENEKSVTCTLSKSELNEIHSRLKIPFREINLLWFVYLLLTNQSNTEIKTMVLGELKETLQKNLQTSPEKKALFQEIAPDGEFVDSFMMMKYSGTLGVHKISNILITTPEICHEEEEQTHQVIETKMQSILQLAASFQKT